MKKIVNEFIWSKNNKTNGLAALCLVSLFALGCMCGKDFKLDSEKESNTSTSNQTSSQTSSNRKLPTFRGDDDKKTETKTSDDADSDDTSTSSGDREEIPSDSGNDILTNGKLQPLIKNTLLDFADAVDAGDFSSFQEQCSKPFKKQFSGEKMTSEFKVFIDKKALAVPILKQVTEKEAIMAESKVAKQGAVQVLTTSGSFPTSPSITSFNLKYILESGVWRIIEVEVRMK